ncbi:isochorismatase hydrolase [Citreicella sp. SE45]|nr:isochorismatase hydrolase [Citreicella sp. SE45]
MKAIGRTARERALSRKEDRVQRLDALHQQLARRVVEPDAAGQALAAARSSGMLIVHTREGHGPDLSDAPPAKIQRGLPSGQIGDPGPMGRILVRGEPDHDSVPAFCPLAGAAGLGMPGIAGMNAGALAESLPHFGFSIPIPAKDHVFTGFELLGFILVTAIPFGVHELVEVMDNVESAEAAGDVCSTTVAISAEGTILLIGTLLGSPFANAVYIGHPGWKAMGERDDGHSTALVSSISPDCKAEPGRDRPSRPLRD